MSSALRFPAAPSFGGRSLVPSLALTSLLVATASGCSGTGRGQAPGGEIAVAAADTSCAVAAGTLQAGSHRFTVTNKGSKTTEFYVLGEGDRIVGEVENIAPGVARSLQVDLAPGTYQTACKPGMAGQGIRAPLTVTGQAARTPEDRRLSAAVDSYRDYVGHQLAALEEKTAEFAAAVRAGDGQRARALYPVARTYYERVEPVAESFGDLDPAIDARENDVEEGHTWTGFHVLEKALWGGDLAGAAPVADRLTADVHQLVQQARDLDLKPLDLANGALGLLDEIAKSKVTGEEERYSHTDLVDVSANLEGSAAAIQSLRPVLAERNAELAGRLDKQFGAARAELDRYRRGDGWAGYPELSRDQLRAVSDAMNALAAEVSKVPDVVAR